MMCRVLSHTYTAPWARQLLAGKYVMILLLLMTMTGQLVSMLPTGSKLFVFWIVAEALQRSLCAVTFLQRTSENMSGNEVELKIQHEPSLESSEPIHDILSNHLASMTSGAVLFRRSWITSL